MPELRQMSMSDLPSVLKIIDTYDDDDAEAAEKDYQECGFDQQFVLEIEEKIVGVTGYREIEACDGSYWLSWTYIDQAHRSQGHGKNMVLELLDKLRANNGRKVFVKVSDYEDPEDGKVYERALNMYTSMGFTLEVTANDFYDEGENQLILGLELKDEQDEAIAIEDEKPIIRFNGLYEIAETEGSYTFNWIVDDKISLFRKRNFSVEDLMIGLNTVKNSGGRKIFLTFPSNLPLIHQPLQAAGFNYIGQLTDYYERGVHELHFTHDLNTL